MSPTREQLPRFKESDQEPHVTASVSHDSVVTVDGVVREAQADVAGLEGGPWDGRRYSYIPSEPLVLDPGVGLHDEFDLEIDPITYQVLRSRLWHSNLEHGDMIQRIAGSFVVVFARDFAVAVLTETGDVVTTGPTIQHLAAQADLVVKWTLEHRGGAPGIGDGDVFLQNDPFVGSAHQVDTGDVRSGVLGGADLLLGV